jgi:hypothetical protein
MSPAEEMARFFHETYEKMAPFFGYETRQETREFDPTSPNGRLMVAVCWAWRQRAVGILDHVCPSCGRPYHDRATDTSTEVQP